MAITARAMACPSCPLRDTRGVLRRPRESSACSCPGLPTTEFIIAASYLFARSSPRLEGWLEGNRWFGPVLRRFRETGGMARKTKALALAWTWSGLSISLYVLAASGIGIQLFVLTMGLVGTVTILFVVRTTAERQPLILS